MKTNKNNSVPDSPIIIHSAVDFLIIIIILFGIYRGYTLGFIVQAISLFALLAGIYLAANLSMMFYNLLVDKSNIPLRNLPVITFSLLFFAVFYGSNWIGLYVKRQVSSINLNLYTKISGAFLGAVKYLFIASIILIFFKRLDDSFNIIDKKSTDINHITESESKQQSKLFNPVLHFAPMIMPKLNFEIRQPDPLEYEDITEEPENLPETE